MSDLIILIIYAVIGGLIGVVINYLADVLPRTRKFSKPVCPHCEKPYTLKGYLISFKCQNCGAKPSPRSFVVLIASILAAVLVGIFPLGGLNFWLTIPILIFLGVVLVIDIEHHAVLIETSIAGLILFAIYGYFIQGLLITGIGGLAGCLIMLAIYFFGIFFSKTMAKIRKEENSEPGMGFGDVYVGAFMGLFAGWPWVVGMIIIAVIVSGLYSFIYLLVKSIRKDYQAYSTIPYAPFLILGAIAIFYIPQIPTL